MRILVNHETVYRYDQPPKAVIQALRLTPRSHDGQHVVRWRIDVDQDVLLNETEDAFGNIVHVFSALGPIDSLRVAVVGEVETEDRAGVVRGGVERFPPSLYRRETDLTRADPALRAFGSAAISSDLTALSSCHALMAAVHETLVFDPDATDAATTAAEALARRRGVAQDFAHVFIAAARSRGIPARYVAGHLLRGEGLAAQAAGHAWAEVHLDDYGWIGFDPANKLCPTESYVRVAQGLDALGAAPVRGARSGGETETLTVTVEVAEREPQRQAGRQPAWGGHDGAQWQSQG